MRSVKFILAAGAASLMSTAVFAADMPIAPPPAMYAPPPVEDFGGWYLRGDIGFSNQKTKGLSNVLNNAPGTTVQTINSDFDTAGIFGVGVGYRFNNWFRADVTGQYRGKANYHGLEVVNFNGAPVGTDEYRGSKSEWLVLANAYVDLGTWWCITPFVGAGVGMSRNTISNFTDINTPTAGVAFGDTASKWNFAWAAHAGLAYKVTPGMTMELGYSYVNLGDAVTGDLRTYTGVNAVYNPTTFKNLTSHDLKLGVRWELDAAPVYLPPPPLVRKG
jgi:opacity protein-like surface antigen